MADEQYKDAASRFLEADFTQCFQQIRHYDRCILELAKFVFTSFVAIGGVLAGLHKYTTDNPDAITAAVTMVSAIAGIFALFFFEMILRYRVYFVVATRYINEHRGHFLRSRPGGFENRSGMYTNHRQPPFLDVSSTHITLALIVGLFSCLSWGVFALTLSKNWQGHEYFVKKGIAPLALILALAHLIFLVLYLRRKEKKTPAAAVFGTDNAS